jgi:hypothetical protein
MEQMTPHVKLVGAEANPRYGFVAKNIRSHDDDDEMEDSQHSSFLHGRTHFVGTMSSIVTGADTTVWGY